MADKRSDMHSHAHVTQFPRSIQITAGFPECQKTLYVHEDILKNCASPSIRALVSSNWRESEQRNIDWQHCDLSTVLWVISYLYTGSYDVDLSYLTSLPELDNLHASETLLGDREAHTDRHGNPHQITSPDAADAASHGPYLSHAVEEEVEELADFQQDRLVTTRSLNGQPIIKHSAYKCMIESDSSHSHLKEVSSEVMSAFLLEHAKVYVFAEMYLISELQTMAISHASDILRWIEMRSILEIRPTVAFIYENTDGLHREDPFRRIMSNFVGRHLLDMQPAVAFELLLNHPRLSASVCFKKAKEAEILRDMVSQIVRRKCPNCQKENLFDAQKDSSGLSRLCVHCFGMYVWQWS